MPIQRYALPPPHRFCIFGGLLFRHRNPTLGTNSDPYPGSARAGNQGRLPMGKGQAPGIAIGRGANGAAIGGVTAVAG